MLNATGYAYSETTSRIISSAVFPNGMVLSFIPFIPPTINPLDFRALLFLELASFGLCGKGIRQGLLKIEFCHRCLADF